jgi:hypothetical protein
MKIADRRSGKKEQNGDFEVGSVDQEVRRDREGRRENNEKKKHQNPECVIDCRRIALRESDRFEPIAV